MPVARAIGVNEAYNLWKYNNLGVYSPVFFPRSNSLNTCCFFSGVGGESLRLFYPAIEPERFLRIHRSHIPSRELYLKLERSFIESVESASAECGVHPMVAHYQCFRDRCHGGRQSLTRFACTPLASRTLRQAAKFLNSGALEKGDLLIDLLLALDDRLALLPYNSPEKLELVKKRKYRLKALDTIEAVGSSRGKVYCDFETKTIGDPHICLL